MAEIRYLRVWGENLELPEIPDALILDRDPVNPRARFPRGTGVPDGLGRIRHPMYANDMPQFEAGSVARWEAQDTTLPGEPILNPIGPILGPVPD